MKPLKERVFSKSTILGYGVAGIGNAIPAGLFYVYFIFFLTTVAGINPAIAGSISLIAVLWDAINDPMIGFLTDNCKSKYGRRRPFVIGGLLPLTVVIILMFTNLNMPLNFKTAWFILLNILFWFFFTFVDVPMIALGDALNTNYDNKTKCRTAWTVLMMCGSVLGESLPPALIDFIDSKVNNVSLSWFIMICVLALITFLAYFIAWNATRGREVIPKLEKTQGMKFSFFKEYLAAFRNKGMRFSMPGVALIYCGFNGAAIPTMAFICTFNLGLPDAQVTLYLLAYTVGSILGSLCLGTISAKFGKKLGGKSKEIAYAFGVYAIASIICFFVGTNHVTVLICLFLLGFTCSAFFLHGWNLALDAAKIEQYKTGEDKGGIYTAMIGFCFKIGGAIGMWLVGLLLAAYGFDETQTVQSESALHGIEITFFLVTGIVLLLACIILFRNPMTRHKMDCLLEALDKKEKGEAIDESGFSDLL